MTVCGKGWPVLRVMFQNDENFIIKLIKTKNGQANGLIGDGSICCE